MPDVVGIDWSKVWAGDDMSLVLTATQRAWLLQFASNLYVAPKLFLTPFEESDEEDINDAIQLLQAALLNVTIPPKADVNNRFYLSPVLATVLSGGRIAIQSGTMYYAQNTPASGNAYEIYESYYLSPGTWHTRFNVMHNSNGGIFKSEVIDVITGTVYDDDTYDTYNVTQSDQHFNMNSFTLTDYAFVKVKISCTGKHASSSNFFVYISAIELFKG